jgi:glycosyltransferase involved in cell wall biosynthesis
MPTEKTGKALPGAAAEPAAGASFDRPTISVILPVLAPDPELRRCIDSVRLAFGSHSSECEIVIVTPAQHVESIHCEMPGVRVVAETRASIFGAMNDGVRASTGQFLYFLGKDDIVLPPFGDAVLALARRKPAAIFFDVYWGERGVYLGNPSPWRLLTRNLCHQGIVYARETIAKHGPYVRRMKVQADHLLNIRVLHDASLRPRLAYHHGALAWYSGAGFSAVTARDPVFWRLYPVILRRYVGAWAACALVAFRRLRWY